MRRVVAWLVLAGCVDGGPGDADAPDVDRSIPDAALWSPADPALWGQCDPALADAWVGDDGWTGSLRVEFGGIYCSLGAPERALEADLAHRALVFFPPGTWPVPGVSGAYAMTLPACVAARGVAPAIPSDVGAVDAEIGAVAATWRGRQGLALDGVDGALGYVLQTPIPPGAAPTVGLDGRDPASWGGFGGTFTLDDGRGAITTLGACRERTWSDVVVEVPLTRGVVRVTARVSPEGDAVVPFEVAGRVDGQPFAVSHHLALAHAPAGGVHAVGARFDAPVAGGDGLRVDGLRVDGDLAGVSVALTDASLGPVELLDLAR